MSDEIQRSLGRIEGKLDMAIEKITTLEGKHESQGMRVSSLEGTRSYAFGVIAAIATAFGVIGSYVGKAFASIIAGH
jgi:hypothetical protein